MVLKMPRLLPKDQKFFDLLESSAKNLLKGAEALQDLVHDYVDVEKKVQNIKDIEHDGDSIIHDIMDKLDKTFITPIDREDIHILASELDDVLDLLQAFLAWGPPKTRRVAVAGGSGGMSVSVADACSQAGLTLPRL